MTVGVIIDNSLFYSIDMHPFDILEALKALILLTDFIFNLSIHANAICMFSSLSTVAKRVSQSSSADQRIEMGTYSRFSSSCQIVGRKKWRLRVKCAQQKGAPLWCCCCCTSDQHYWSAGTKGWWDSCSLLLLESSCGTKLRTASTPRIKIESKDNRKTYVFKQYI